MMIPLFSFLLAVVYIGVVAFAVGWDVATSRARKRYEAEIARLRADYRKGFDLTRDIARQQGFLSGCQHGYAKGREDMRAAVDMLINPPPDSPDEDENQCSESA